MGASNAIAPVYVSDEGDEGLYAPEQAPKRDTRSKLIRSKEKYPGKIINVCKRVMGAKACKDEQLDEQQYCRHLVGFTDPDNENIFYPFKFRVPLDKNGNPLDLSKLKRVRLQRYLDGEDPQPVLKTDRKIQVTTCFRVYRDVDEQETAVAPGAAEAELWTPEEKADATDASV